MLLLAFFFFFLENHLNLVNNAYERIQFIDQRLAIQSFITLYIYIYIHNSLLSLIRPKLDFSYKIFLQLLYFTATSRFSLISLAVRMRTHQYFPRLKFLIKVLWTTSGWMATYVALDKESKWETCEQGDLVYMLIKLFKHRVVSDRYTQ